LPTYSRNAIVDYSHGYDRTMIQSATGMSDEANAAAWLKAQNDEIAAQTESWKKYPNAVDEPRKPYTPAEAVAHVSRAKSSLSEIHKVFDDSRVPNYVGPTYRGLHGLSEQAVDALISGEPVDLTRGAGIMSTSYDFGIAANFATTKVTTGRSVVIEVVRKNAKGILIESVSTYDDEREVLVRGGMYRQTRVRRAMLDGRQVTIVTMTEV
jgi:hypothetical protein